MKKAQVVHAAPSTCAFHSCTSRVLSIYPLLFPLLCFVAARVAEHCGMDLRTIVSDIDPKHLQVLLICSKSVYTSSVERLLAHSAVPLQLCLMEDCTTGGRLRHGKRWVLCCCCSMTEKKVHQSICVLTPKMILIEFN